MAKEASLPHHMAEYEANTEWHQSCIHHNLHAVMGHTCAFLAAFLTIADMQLQRKYQPHTPYGYMLSSSIVDAELV